MTETRPLDRVEDADIQAAVGSVVYVCPGTAPRSVPVTQETTVMELAVEHGIPGIVGVCGGQAMCGTCHVKVREEYLPGLPEPYAEELDILDSAVDHRDPLRSRLGCQLPVTPESTLIVDVVDSE
ncbi:2Fe-2S iron-sulfur cluster-binding protein [Nocardia sp. NPDC050378]|uniref:2Fe-2S iron-sulfur cluster-binding protein n=1 Tax=Nocardia sp. NPDC050378 TaxID=3155400 RepID=UPI0033E5E802